MKLNLLKKYTGIVWIAISVIAYSVLLKTSYSQIIAKPTTETLVQWTIFDIIFLPIAIGLVIFGWLALKGEYAHLPESSDEIED